MDFSLNDTQREVAELAGRIFRDLVTQTRLRSLDGAGYHDSALWAQLADSGLLGLAIPEAQGGMGLDFETLCLLLEQAGRCAAPVPLLPVLVTGAWVLQRCAGAVDVTTLLAGVAAGTCMVTAAFDEVGQTDLRRPGTQARYEAGSWRLDGAKTAVLAGPLASHAWATATGPDGLVILLVDLNQPSVQRVRQTGTTGAYQSRLVFEQASASLLAEGSAASAWLDTAEMATWAAAASHAVGLAEEMTRLGAEYTTQREQFGKPIGSFQAVAHRLADAYIDTECLRAATIRAVWAVTHDRPEALEAAMVAKVWAADALHRVSHGVQQVHGGAGVDRDYPLFRYALAAKQTELHFGGAGQLLERLGRTLVAPLVSEA